MLLPEEHEADIAPAQKATKRQQERALSRYEKTVFAVSSLILIMMSVCAVWSGILLLTDTVEGGGPLGMLMRLLPVHLLLTQ